jgi:hypothetical protein
MPVALPPGRLKLATNGLEVEHQVEPGWLKHREVGRLVAAQDAVDIESRLPTDADREVTIL